MNSQKATVVDPPLWLLLTSIMLIAFWLLGNLLRFTTPLGGIVYPHDVVFILIPLLLHKESVDQLKKIVLAFQHKPLLITLYSWIVLGWLVAWLTGESPLFGILYTSRLFLYAFSTTLLIQKWKVFPLPVHLKTKDVLVTPVITFSAITVFFALLGLLQYIFLPDTRWLAIFGWDDHYSRLLSTQLDPNFAGLIIGIGLITATALPVKMWRFISLGILSISLLLTWSRASWAAVAVALLWLAWKKSVKGTLLVTAVCIALGVVVFFIPKPAGEGGNIFRTSTVLARFSATRQWLQTLQPYHWITGKGLFIPSTQETTFALANNARQPDSWPVTLFVGTGMVGVVLFLLIAASLRSQWQHVHPYQQATFLAVFIHGLFNNSITQPFIFLALVAILLSDAITPSHYSNSKNNGK